MVKVIFCTVACHSLVSEDLVMFVTDVDLCESETCLVFTACILATRSSRLLLFNKAQGRFKS